MDVHPEIDVMAATLAAHSRDVDGYSSELCICGRNPARSFDEHVAEEIVTDLTNAGMGVFQFEYLDLVAGGDHWQPET